jgi:hypothetical protein
VPADPLLSAGDPERVNYATGVLLQADDFRDEQTYHRGRLAAALVHLVGHGTLAGLAVRAPEAGDNDLHLQVEPGLAIDRWGRLIEVGEAWCTRLARWFAAQTSGDLIAALQRSPRTAFPIAVVADVFLTLADCGRGKTPSIAQGPFDALDALVPARLAEQPQLTLVLRAEGPPDPIPTPANHWPDSGAATEARLAAVLGSYRPGLGLGIDGGLAPLAEDVGNQDPAAVFLGRVTIPVTYPDSPPPDARPALDLTQPVHVDNRARPFICLPGKWLGMAPTAVPTNEP